MDPAQDGPAKPEMGDTMKYRILKAGEVIVDGDEENCVCDETRWEKVPPEFIGLRINESWDTSVRRPIKPKPKPKKPLSAFGHPCINAYKAYHGIQKHTHCDNPRLYYVDRTAWCRNCGAVSFSGKAWKLPKSARHPYYPVGP